MKKFAAVLLASALIFAAPSASYAAGIAEDSVIDKAGDWFAVMGKPENEKELIIADRRAARASDRMEKALRAEAKKAGREMEKLGKEMGKAFDN